MKKMKIKDFMEQLAKDDSTLNDVDVVLTANKNISPS